MYEQITDCKKTGEIRKTEAGSGAARRHPMACSAEASRGIKPPLQKS